METKINKKVIKILSLGHFVTDAYSGFLNPIMPFIAAKIGITMAAAAVLISVSNLTSSLSQPFFGYIADKWQRRFFIFWGMILASICLSFLGIANNIYTLIILLLVGHMGVSFFHPQATSIVSNYSKCIQNSKDMSIFIAAGTFGFALGPAVSSGITEYFGMNKLPIVCVIGVITAFILLKKVPKIQSLNIEKPKVSIIGAIKKIFQNKPVSILVAASIVKSFVVSSFSIILPFYWKSIGYNVSTIGYTLLMFLLAGAFGVISSPFFEKRIGIKNVFYLSLITIAPLGIIFYIMQGKGIIGIIAFILIGYLSFLAVPVNMSLAQRLMPEFKSMISGFIGGFSWGVIGLLLPAISLIAEKTGIMNILVAMTFIPAIFSYFIKYLPAENPEES
ncbi:MAG: MFS transporter [Candidatus Gastranaerophilales bacterium]|nr:MFS transporter [Candidatus Gastranaerophilales bacterium]